MSQSLHQWARKAAVKASTFRDEGLSLQSLKQFHGKLYVLLNLGARLVGQLYLVRYMLQTLDPRKLVIRVYACAWDKVCCTTGLEAVIALIPQVKRTS